MEALFNRFEPAGPPRPGRAAQSAGGGSSSKGDGTRSGCASRRKWSPKPDSPSISPGKTSTFRSAVIQPRVCSTFRHCACTWTLASICSAGSFRRCAMRRNNSLLPDRPWQSESVVRRW